MSKIVWEEALEAHHEGFVQLLRMANKWRVALIKYGNAVEKLADYSEKLAEADSSIAVVL